MVTNIKQTAYGNNLLVSNFPYRKFQTVLFVNSHGRNTLFITPQHLVIKCVVPKHICNGICGRKHENSLLVAPYHFGLIAMFFVVCFTPGIELIQIGFIKFDNHFRPFLSAKIAANFYIRKLSNTLFLYKENPHFAVWKTFGTFEATLLQTFSFRGEWGKRFPKLRVPNVFHNRLRAVYFPESVERIDASHNPKLKPEEFWDEVDTLITKGCLPYTI